MLSYIFFSYKDNIHSGIKETYNDTLIIDFKLNY